MFHLLLSVSRLKKNYTKNFEAKIYKFVLFSELFCKSIWENGNEKEKREEINRAK
jgi:hypothetical protein